MPDDCDDRAGKREERVERGWSEFVISGSGETSSNNNKGLTDGIYTELVVHEIQLKDVGLQF